MPHGPQGHVTRGICCTEPKVSKGDGPPPAQAESSVRDQIVGRGVSYQDERNYRTGRKKVVSLEIGVCLGALAQ